MSKEGLADLWNRFSRERAVTETLAAPLTPEDCNIQSSPEVSPTKWHLSHTSWFFEHFVLKPYLPGYREFHPQFSYLFNSYYETVGAFSPKSTRGLLSRPALSEVMEYRKHVTDSVQKLLGEPNPKALEAAPIILLGINHEQQHQELLLMDIKHVFASHPFRPTYLATEAETVTTTKGPEFSWKTFPAELYEIGHEGQGFHFDNEGPRHPVYVGEYALKSGLVTNSEFLKFMNDGGYEKPELWLSDGWNEVKLRAWKAPLYWEETQSGWKSMTLSGLHPIVEAAPVCHVSYYEADAFARWAGKRLPTEMEWEVAAETTRRDGNFLESGKLNPVPLSGPKANFDHLHQMWGDVWEWTASSYSAYPGFRPNAGSLGEYNGKFMCNQMVLRGGACVTPLSHIRASYRNFYSPSARWQFSGLRLAEDR